MNLKPSVISLMFLFCCKLVISQQNNTLFFMHDLPQANIANPAIPIKCKLYVGIPVLGSLYINQYSTGFSAGDLLTPYSGDSLRFTPIDAVHSMNRVEIVAAEVQIPLLSVGYRYKTHYFTFAVTEKINNYNFIPKNMALLALEGNSRFEGINVNMDGLRVNMSHYREYALGWAGEVNETFRLGGRIKLLYGKTNVNMNPSQTELYTDPRSFALNINSAISVNTSLPVTFTTDSNGLVSGIEDVDMDIMDYLRNTENKGMGVDLGFVYKINEQTTLSGSILDLGGITWRSNVQGFSSRGEYYIEGGNNEKGYPTAESIGDTLQKTFEPVSYQSAYGTALAPTIYLGATRMVTEKFNVGGLLHADFFKRKWHPSLSLSGNARISDALSLSASYTIQNKQFNNVGLGMGLKMGIVHFHMISDNITGLLLPFSARNINLRFGLGILMGCEKKQRKQRKQTNCWCN